MIPILFPATVSPHCRYGVSYSVRGELADPAGRDAAKKYAEMKQHETDLQTEIAGLQTQRMERMAKLARIREYMDTLRASGRITEFDP